MVFRHRFTDSFAIDTLGWPEDKLLLVGAGFGLRWSVAFESLYAAPASGGYTAYQWRGKADETLNNRDLKEERAT
jgi:hypothetical protein